MSGEDNYSASPEPAPAPSRKRKSAAAASASKSKKARASTQNASTGVSNPVAKQLVQTVLDNAPSYEDGNNPQALGNQLVLLANYARELEEDLARGGGQAMVKPAKSRADLEAAADKLRRAAMSGIKKQMSWKPSCKMGSAKWSYDGICADPEVFGVLMGLDGPPTWKMKKFSREDFEEAVGEISASARYSDLEITSKDVTVRYSDEGTFKFSGSYGIPQPEPDTGF
ncbi:hypothetical protein EWM64_g10707 [Hericium alpestre]|uniref:Uncharacterized protein n=1 Tax=Hericium alpestre TaxID=135208 RepID=A0A4Y9ZEW1_9AGAM|nr:hypothetical protein EWM64_g10707 [Hericium alpestre]